MMNRSARSCDRSRTACSAKASARALTVLLWMGAAAPAHSEQSPGRVEPPRSTSPAERELAAPSESDPQSRTKDASVTAADVETITVLGRRGAELPLSGVPAAISVVPRDELLREQATAPRIEDLLSRKVPGFNPTNNGVRQIRGRTAQVFVNGVPVNQQMRAGAGADLGLLPIDQIGGVEVARGANSAYGFGSPGGIIALATPRARSEELALLTRMRVGVNPYHVSRSAQLSFYQSAAQIIGPFDFHVGGSIGYDGLEYDADGDRALAANSPTGLAFNSAEAPLSADASLGYDFGRGGELRFTGTYGRVDVHKAYTSDFTGEYGKNPSSIVRFHPGDAALQRAYTLNLAYQNRLLGSTAKLELLQSEVYSENYGDLFSIDPPTRDEQTNAYRGVRSSLTTPLDRFVEGASATYGFDAMRNRFYRPVFFERGAGMKTAFAPDTTLDVYAPYLQLEVPLGPLRLSAGVRSEHYRGHVDAVDTSASPNPRDRLRLAGGDIDRFTLTLFNAGVTYSLSTDVELYASYTQGAELSQLARAARDVARIDPDRPAAPAASPKLIDAQPAKSDQYEIGLRSSPGDLEYGISAFFTTSDLLSTLQTDPADPTGPLLPLREPRQFYGVEANVRWHIDERWSMGGVFGWYDGRRETPTDKRRPISSRDVPPFLASSFIEFSPVQGWRNTLQLDFRSGRDPFGRNGLPFESEGRIRQLALLHWMTAFDVGRGELAFGIRNLLNEDYFGIASEADLGDAFSYIPEQGTRLTVSYSQPW
jgi:iron complex outermembrane receptor protein